MTPAIALPSGEKVPRLGQGTWMMGRRKAWASEVAALRLGIDLGMTLIDTAQMYGDAEYVVGEAIEGQREKIFLVSKVQPHNATRKGVVEACERSLTKLKTEIIDLYLLHWPSSYAISETVEGFELLMKAGKIRHWGVSNFDVAEMEEVLALPRGRACATNQILYNLSRRGPEYDLAPWLEKHRIPLMAYRPIEQGRLRVAGALDDVARAHGLTPYAAAIAWVLNKPNTIVIPKAGSETHVRENAKAAGIVFSKEDHARLDAAFKPPRRAKPLESI
jgi:diketogulonate reductase-like aldo/keto reductase